MYVKKGQLESLILYFIGGEGRHREGSKEQWVAFGLFWIFRTTPFSIRLCDPGRAQSYCLAEWVSFTSLRMESLTRALMTVLF